MPYIGIFWQDFSKNYSYIGNQHPQTCLFANFHDKNKIPKFGTKCVWFTCFWDGIWKEYVIFEISTLESSNCEILRRKTPNFCTKILLLGISKREFSKTIVIFEMNTFKFVYLQNFVKKQKWLGLRPKMPYLSICDQKCHI